MDIILASNSPRRRELLSLITTHFTVEVSHVDEKFDKALLPHEIVLYLSRIKAQEVFRKHPETLVIGADTIVVCENEILEKPLDKTEAYSMLKKLSGKTHQVITGVTLLTNETTSNFYSQTDVTFYEMTDDEIYSYINTGEPFDKAGGYGIQGFASKYIKDVKGDYFTVVGLPVSLLYQYLKRLGFQNP